MADSVLSRNQRHNEREDSLEKRNWKDVKKKDHTKNVVIRGVKMPDKQCGNCGFYVENRCRPRHAATKPDHRGCGMHIYMAGVLPPVPRINLFEEHKKKQKKTTEKATI